jgi:hypothetical protein
MCRIGVDETTSSVESAGPDSIISHISIYEAIFQTIHGSNTIALFTIVYYALAELPSLMR